MDNKKPIELSQDSFFFKVMWPIRHQASQEAGKHLTKRQGHQGGEAPSSILAAATLGKVPAV